MPAELSKDAASQLGILSKRASLLAWPLVNPVTQRLLDDGCIAIRNKGRIRLDGEWHRAVFVEITDKGKRAL